MAALCVWVGGGDGEEEKAAQTHLAADRWDYGLAWNCDKYV